MGTVAMRTSILYHRLQGQTSSHQVRLGISRKFNDEGYPAVAVERLEDRKENPGQESRSFRGLVQGSGGA